MKSYKKEIAVLAAMALFTPWVNAQVNVSGLGMTSGGAGPFTVEGDATVNGSLLVEPNTATIDTLSATGAAGVPPTIENNGDGTSTVSSRISTVEAERIANTAGGVQIDTNGNVALTPEETTTSNLRYGIFSQFNVDNATNTPITSTTYIAAVVDDEGNFISELPGINVDTTDPDPLNWTIDLDDPLLDSNDILVDTSTATANGNLQVGGNANVDGVLSLAAGDPDGVADTGDEWDAVANVAEAIGDNETAIDAEETARIAADVVLQDNIDAEETARIAADGVLQDNIDAEETARIAADEVLQDNIDAEETARIAADGVLQDNIDAEETARIAADGVLQDNIDAEETARIAADGVLQDNIDAEETARIAADEVLQDNINAEVSTRSALIRREGDGFVHIGENSLIFDDTNPGFDQLTSSKSNLIIGGGATTDVAIDANLDVAGDASFQKDVFVAGDIFVGGRTQGLQKQIDNNREDIDRNARGIAMVAALQHTTVLPDMKHALDLSAAHFEGETGMALNYARRINDNVQINFGAASTSDFDESVIKAGIGVQW